MPLRSMRAVYLFAATMVVFFFGNASLAVVLANSDHLDILVTYAIVVGIIGIFLALGLILYLLTRPPFARPKRL